MKTPLTFLTLLFAALASLSANAENETWPGTLYRNGGHFGVTNSDVSLQPNEAIIAGAPSFEASEPEAVPASSGMGMLSRNGGLENRADNLSFDP